MTKVHKKNRLILDICPKCKAIWFDANELLFFKGKTANVIEKARKLALHFLCVPCGIKLNSKDLRATEQGNYHCPRCNQLLSFEGSGEVVKTRILPRGIVAIIIFIFGLLFLYFITLKLFHSVHQARMFTATIGVASMVIIVRAIVYGRFAWAFWCRLKDFKL